jgi:hypothetical protein
VLGSSLFFEERTGRHIRVEEMDPRPTVLFNSKNPSQPLTSVVQKIIEPVLTCNGIRTGRVKEPPVNRQFFAGSSMKTGSSFKFF